MSLAPSDTAGLSWIPFVDLSSDGRGYVYSYPPALSTLYVVEGLK